MKVVVIDNDSIFLNSFLTLINQACHRLFGHCEILSYNSFQQNIVNDCDLVFLDIDLDDDNGIDIAKKIRACNKKTKIIFVTAMNHLVYNALTVQPFYFIRKNQLELDLPTAFSLLKDALEEKEIYTFLYNGIEKNIYIDDIVYVDVNDHLCSLHMSNKVEYHFYKPLNQIINEINSSMLCQIHKKYFVNLKHVKTMKGNSVKLSQGIELVIGRKYKDTSMNAFENYIREEGLY